MQLLKLISLIFFFCFQLTAFPAHAKQSHQSAANKQDSSDYLKHHYYSPSRALKNQLRIAQENKLSKQLSLPPEFENVEELINAYESLKNRNNPQDLTLEAPAADLPSSPKQPDKLCLNNRNNVLSTLIISP